MASSLPSTMKAARKTGAGPLDKILAVHTDVPPPKNARPLPADHVLIQVSYTSLNPFDFKLAEAPIIGRLVYPDIPCLDFAGTVMDSTSSRFEKGASVYGQTQPPNFGACAEYIVVADKFCLHVLENMKLEDAATIGIAGLTAYQSIIPFVKSGDRVFINGGSGGIGTYEIQFAKAMGCSVTTTCSGANSDLCRSLGADEVIDYRSQNVIETLENNGQQYDLIVDNIFSDLQLYWSSERYLKPGGDYVTMAASPNLGFLRDFLMATLWPRILGGGKRKFQLVGRASNREDYQQIAKWIKQGTVQPCIEQIYPLDDIKEAFAKLKSGRARGKLVVKIA